METILANLRGRTRKASLHGRDYIVADMVMIVPGVLNGSGGPVYYSPEENSRSVQAWNGMPIVVYHPLENGMLVSARTPYQADRRKIGDVFSARVDNKGRLLAEGWFDVELTRKVDPRVYDALVSNTPIELSTGLGAILQPVSNDARDQQGREYNYLAVDYKPDHLAVLPDQQGACSLKDGCGVLMNSAAAPTPGSRSLIPLSDSSTLDWQPVQNLGGEEMPLSAQQRKAIVDELVANCDCWKGPRDSDLLMAFPDEKLTTLKDNFDKVQQAITVANAAISGYVAGDSAYRVNPTTGRWETALVNKTEEKPKEPAQNETTKEEEQELRNNRNGINVSKLKTEDDWMRIMPADLVNKMRAADQILQVQKNDIISKILANVSDENARREQTERLHKLGMDDLSGILALIPQASPEDQIANRVNKGRVRRQEPDDMLTIPTLNWKDTEGRGTTQEVKRQTVVNEADDHLSEEDYLSSLPPSMRSELQNARAIVAREKRTLINELVANVTDEDAERRLVSRLQHKTLEELRDLVALSPRKETPKPNYFGQSTPGMHNRINNDTNEDLLPPPSMNWKDISKSN